MKKLLICFVVSSFTVVNGWADDETRSTKEIECSLVSFVRSSKDVPPLAVVNESTSTNWSGYVAATNLNEAVPNSVNAVLGSWIVPTLTATPNDTYCALWVGIDGYLSGTVEQIGTEHDWIGGQQQNYAWFEMYPDGSYQIQGFPVDNGDSISATVKYAGTNTFVMTIVNNTKGVHTIIPTAFTKSSKAQRSSAEWVLEAPATSTGILPLADFGAAVFAHCQANINGIRGSISDGHWQNDGITMEGKNGVKATTSNLINQGNRFNLAWESE